MTYQQGYDIIMEKYDKLKAEIEAKDITLEYTEEAQKKELEENETARNAELTKYDEDFKATMNDIQNVKTGINYEYIVKQIEDLDFPAPDPLDVDEDNTEKMMEALPSTVNNTKYIYLTFDNKYLALNAMAEEEFEKYTQQYDPIKQKYDIAALQIENEYTELAADINAKYDALVGIHPDENIEEQRQKELEENEASRTAALEDNETKRAEETKPLNDAYLLTMTTIATALTELKSDKETGFIGDVHINGKLHVDTDINLEGSLNNIPIADYLTKTDKDTIDAAIDGKASSSHTHTISNITDLQKSLDSKADSGHTHTLSDITDYETYDDKDVRDLIATKPTIKQYESFDAMIADWRNVPDNSICVSPDGPTTYPASFTFKYNNNRSLTFNIPKKEEDYIYTRFQGESEIDNQWQKRPSNWRKIPVLTNEDNILANNIKADNEIRLATVEKTLKTKADANHTHSEYALKAHTHDYAASNHTHSGYALKEHTHDYAASNHTHNEYALKEHTHDYAASNHTHNEYALKEHTHDYAASNHSHSEYALTTHTHDYAASSHTHTSSQITFNSNIIFADSGTSTREIRLIAGTNDSGRIAFGATERNTGWMEIATADDLTEPIYIRQYKGVNGNYFGNVGREAVLLDASGNTSFPGTLIASNVKDNNETRLATVESSLTTKADASHTHTSFGDIEVNTINGYSIANSAAPFIAKVGKDGVMEVGKIMDFHTILDGTQDRAIRLTCSNTTLACSGYFTSTNVKSDNETRLAAAESSLTTKADASHTHTVSEITDYAPYDDSVIKKILEIDNDGNARAIHIYNTSTKTTSYLQFGSFYYPNQIEGQNLNFMFGKQASARKCGYIGYTHSNTAPYIAFGFHSVNESLKIYTNKIETPLPLTATNLKADNETRLAAAETKISESETKITAVETKTNATLKETIKDRLTSFTPDSSSVISYSNNIITTSIMVNKGETITTQIRNADSSVVYDLPHKDLATSEFTCSVDITLELPIKLLGPSTWKVYCNDVELGTCEAEHRHESWDGLDDDNKIPTMNQINAIINEKLAAQEARIATLETFNRYLVDGFKNRILYCRSPYHWLSKFLGRLRRIYGGHCYLGQAIIKIEDKDGIVSDWPLVWGLYTDENLSATTKYELGVTDTDWNVYD